MMMKASLTLISERSGGKSINFGEYQASACHPKEENVKNCRMFGVIKIKGERFVAKSRSKRNWGLRTR